MSKRNCRDEISELREEGVTMKKFLRRSLALVLLLSVLWGFGGITTKADAAEPYVYVDEAFKVTYMVNGEWGDCVTASIEIENISSETIDNWFLGMALDGEIEEIWNAAVYRHVKEHYVIKNANYNSSIAPGEKVSFGCVIRFSDTAKLPEEFYMPIRTEEVRAGRYEVHTEIVSAWEDGQEYRITVQNNSKQTIEDWTVAFDFGGEISSLWNSALVSKENGHYVLTNNNYNNTIAPGGNVSFGFIANGSQPLYLENIVLNEITSDGITIAEKLVDARNFADFDIVSEEYEVTPLYTIDGRISAYLVQYYSSGEPTGYIVVSNEVDCLNYYIEFGYGIPGMILTMADTVEEECGKPVDRVIYVGGYTYYALVEDTVYTADTGEVRPLSEEEELLLAVAASEPQYYEYGVTLTLADVYAKEVGYASVITGNSPNIPALTVFKTMSETKAAYWEICKSETSSHCGPTAALNLLFYLDNQGYTPLPLGGEKWKNVFCKLYDDMGTTPGVGTYDDDMKNALTPIFYAYKGTQINYSFPASWEDAINYVTKGAVILNLQNSQIYGYHFVLAIGYNTFSFSSGWSSRYFRIIDSWTHSDGTIDRYVNYSLGIDSISALLVKPSR